MLKKLAVLALVLGTAFAVLLLTARESTFCAEESLAIARPSEVIWEALSAVDQWPRWWPGMEHASLAGEMEEGAVIELSLKGNPHQEPALLVTFIPQREMAWERSGILGSFSRTRLRLLPGEGGTVVTLESRIHGPQAVFARYAGRKDFDNYHESVLTALRGHLETYDSAEGGR